MVARSKSSLLGRCLAQKQTYHNSRDEPYTVERLKGKETEGRQKQEGNKKKSGRGVKRPSDFKAPFYPICLEFESAESRSTKTKDETIIQ